MIFTKDFIDRAKALLPDDVGLHAALDSGDVHSVERIIAVVKVKNYLPPEKIVVILEENEESVAVAELRRIGTFLTEIEYLHHTAHFFRIENDKHQNWKHIRRLSEAIPLLFVAPNRHEQPRLWEGED